MYIKMNDDKSLVITIPTTIYRGETRADIITFLVPSSYGPVNVADGEMILRYIGPDGIGRSEPLAYLPEKYKDYLQFSTVINTKLTSNEGEIILWLAVVDGDKQVVLKSGEAIVEIQPSQDITMYLPDEDIDQLDSLVIRMDRLENTKADNIMFDRQTSTIQLLSNGVPVGDRIMISVDVDVCVSDVTLNENNELLIHFEDGTEKNLGKIASNNVVYVPHVDERKVLTFTIEDAAGEIPGPVDLNPNDEWGEMDDTSVVSDYVWEDM